MNTNMLKMSYCSFSNAGETSNHDCNTSKKHLLINAKMREKSIENFHSVLNQFRKESRFCDFEIRISKQSFFVHKIILAVSSSYFDAMFNNEDKFVENSNNFIEIHDIHNPMLFELILDFIYTANININSNNVQEIARIANMLQLMDLVEMCSEYLRTNLKPSNCVGILCFADLHGFHKLCFEAKRFVEKNFAEIIKEDEFLELPHNIFKSFLKSENLSIDSEYQVLTSTIKWVLHNEENRLQYLDEFVNIVRMPVIPKEQIEKLKNNFNHPEVVRIIDLYLNSTVDSNEHDSNLAYDSIRQQPRMCARRSLYVIGGQFKVRNDDRALSKMERFDMHTRKWSQESHSIIPRSNHCAVLLNNKIYVIGGKCDSLILDSMEIFSSDNAKWHYGPSLNQPRTDFSACAHGSFIYVFGGDGNICSNTIERFDPSYNKWSYWGEMPFPLHSMHVVEHNGIIYIIGGVSHGIVSDKVLAYNPKTRSFSTMASLNDARSKFACTVLHDNIYVIGGTNSSGSFLNSVEQYNPRENTWSNLAPMPVAKTSICALSVNDLIYVFGGKVNYFDNYKMVKNVEVFDPVNNQWLYCCKPMFCFRSDAAAILM